MSSVGDVDDLNRECGIVRLARNSQRFRSWFLGDEASLTSVKVEEKQKECVTSMNKDRYQDDSGGTNKAMADDVEYDRDMNIQD